MLPLFNEVVSWLFWISTLMWGIHQRKLLWHAFKLIIESPYLSDSDYTWCSGSQCSTKPFLGWVFKHKIIFCIDILQLTRTVSQKQNYRSQKARLVQLETFPQHGLWWIRPLFLSWQVVLSTCWFYSLSGTSIMESVVLRSGPCYNLNWKWWLSYYLSFWFLT